MLSHLHDPFLCNFNTSPPGSHALHKIANTCIWRDRNTSFSTMCGRYDRARCSDNFNHKKVKLYTDGRPWAIAYLLLPIAACDYKLDRIQFNFVKMKQEVQGYNITSDKFVRNILKITWQFLQENFDNFRRKVLTIFLWKVYYVLQKNFTIFAEKFYDFWKKI